MAVSFIQQIIDIRGNSFDSTTGEPLNGKWFDIKNWTTTATQGASTASLKADEASASAVVASDKAGIATTKANEASVSAVDAANSLAGINTQLDEATTQANNAAASATAASTSASQALASETVVADFSTSALNSKDVASQKALEASLSAVTIANNLLDVETRQADIIAMQDNVLASETNALTYANNSASSANEALVSENNAKVSETNAADSAASVNASNIIHTEGSGLDNELLTYLKTLDGAGSGLDADKLDSLEAVDFSRSISDVSDLDLATTSGVYDYNGWANLPSGAGDIGSVIVSNSVGGTTAARQIYVDSLNNAFTRYGSGIPTVWGSWVSMWNSANQGAGSGLDADLLDGFHLSSIAKKTDYATSTVGGTVKMRVDGDTLYITNDGSDA